MPINIPNKRLVIKSDDTSLWTTVNRLGTDYISEIPSLESTGVSLVQATDANQPFLEGGVIKTPPGEIKNMTVGTGAGDLTTTGAVFVVSIRFKELQSASGGNTHIFATRTDLASWYILMGAGGGGVLGVNIPGLSTVSVNYNEINTITFAGNVDTGQVKAIVNDGAIAVGEGVSVAGQGDIFFFGENDASRERHFYNVFLAEHYPSDAEMQEIHSFTQNGMPIAPRLVLTKNDAPVQGAVVKFFEMDAFSANAIDNTTVFQTVNLLPGVFQTDSNGIAQYDGAFDDTKVQGCMYVYGEYDTTWKFAVRGKLGSENINLSAPV